MCISSFLLIAIGAYLLPDDEAIRAVLSGMHGKQKLSVRGGSFVTGKIVMEGLWIHLFVVWRYLRHDLFAGVGVVVSFGFSVAAC